MNRPPGSGSPDHASNVLSNEPLSFGPVGGSPVLPRREIRQPERLPRSAASVSAADLELVRGELRQALTEGLREVSDRVEARLDTIVDTVTARLLKGLDVATSDLRRGMVAAQEVQADAATRLATIAGDTQLSLESRSRILEQSLTAHARRTEAALASAVQLLVAERVEQAEQFEQFDQFEQAEPTSQADPQLAAEIATAVSAAEARLRRVVQKSVGGAVNEITQAGAADLRAALEAVTTALDRLSPPTAERLNETPDVAQAQSAAHESDPSVDAAPRRVVAVLEEDLLPDVAETEPPAAPRKTAATKKTGQAAKAAKKQTAPARKPAAKAAPRAPRGDAADAPRPVRVIAVLSLDDSDDDLEATPAARRLDPSSPAEPSSDPEFTSPGFRSWSSADHDVPDPETPAPASRAPIRRPGRGRLDRR